MTLSDLNEEQRLELKQSHLTKKMDERGESPSYGELAEAGEYFEKLGRRYGLLQEFRENAIC